MNETRESLMLALKKLSRKLKAGKAGPHSNKGYKRHKKHKEKEDVDEGESNALFDWLGCHRIEMRLMFSYILASLAGSHLATSGLFMSLIFGIPAVLLVLRMRYFPRKDISDFFDCIPPKDGLQEVFWRRHGKRAR